MQVTVIGTGYVGLVSGTCLAESGNRVLCVDRDAARVERMRNGEVPIYEPGLEGMVPRNVEKGRLTFSTSLEEGIRHGRVLVIAVGTPSSEDGSADLSQVKAVARDIGACLDEFRVVVIKSTVPVGTTEMAGEVIREGLRARGLDESLVEMAFCPEFLKEGSAVDDFLKPDRIIIGAGSPRAHDALEDLFAPFTMRENRIMHMSIRSAELTKYASNAMLATRISFMNELARFADLAGADIEEVRQGMGKDARIGPRFLYPGIGYGGSCFPKDVKALIHAGEEQGYAFRVLQSVEDVNEAQKRYLLDLLTDRYGSDLTGRSFAVWGLSFKPHTDDMREAPAIPIVKGLLERGAAVHAYDPVAMENAARIFGDREGLVYGEDPYDVLDGADALLLLTEWPQFRSPDFEKVQELLKEPIIFDGRNQYDPRRMADRGFTCHGIGRGAAAQAVPEAGEITA